MRHLLTVYLILSVARLSATDYRDITTFTGPCARELAVMAKEGDVKIARDQARALCLAETTKACPDLWIVYAHCEVALDEPEAVALTEEVVRRLPESAPAQMLHALAIGQDLSSGGLFRALRLLGNMRRAFERAVELDPDCHPARAAIAFLYSVPKLLGGNRTKLDFHLAELARRDPYHAAFAHGMIEAQRKNFSAAYAYYREAQRLDSLNHDPVRGLIKTSSAYGDYSDAFTLCSAIKPAFAGDGTKDEIFVELSARSGLRTDEALTASARYIATAKGVAPVDRAKVLINTAIILKNSGRIEESDKQIAEAKSQWRGTDKLFHENEKYYRSKRTVVASK